MNYENQNRALKMFKVTQCVIKKLVFIVVSSLYYFLIKKQDYVIEN